MQKKYKIIFIGNTIGGDDGIGPFLYEALKDDKTLQGLEMLELGVIGLDLLSYIDEEDNLIIVDAAHAQSGFGEVYEIDPTDLEAGMDLVSQHDLGVEQTIAMIRSHFPTVGNICIIGIKVRPPERFSQGLSSEIMKMMPQIKKNVTDMIINMTGKGAILKKRHI